MTESGSATHKVDSKDYWDLVFGQLRKRRSVIVASLLLVLLYAVAIYAPFLANDRPLVFTGTDYGSYRGAQRLVPLAANDLADKALRGEDGFNEWAAAEAERRLDDTVGQAGGHETLLESSGLAEWLGLWHDSWDTSPTTQKEWLAIDHESLLLRLGAMRRQLAEEHHPKLDRVAEAADQLVRLSLASDAELTATGDDEQDQATPAEQRAAAAEELRAAAAVVRGELRPARYGEEPEEGRKVALQPYTSYPVLESLGLLELYFMVLWLLVMTWPVWNPLVNTLLLFRKRHRIRRARRRKLVVVLLVPAVAVIGWVVAQALLTPNQAALRRLHDLASVFGQCLLAGLLLGLAWNLLGRFVVGAVSLLPLPKRTSRRLLWSLPAAYALITAGLELVPELVAAWSESRAPDLDPSGLLGQVLRRFGIGVLVVGLLITLWEVCVSLGSGLDGVLPRVRSRGWRTLLGSLPVGATVVWAVVLSEPVVSFQSTSLKEALSSEKAQAERVELTAVAYGMAEQNQTETFRPPTWTDRSAKTDEGFYQYEIDNGSFKLVDSGMVDEATGEPILIPVDPATDIPVQGTPVIVSFGEPERNAPDRHVLGTDSLGRDLLARMIWGARISLSVGLISTVLLVFIGTIMGSLAGYFGGWVDTVISRVIEIFQCFPVFFLILIVVSFLGPSILNIMLAIGIFRWTGVARLVRGEFIRLRGQDFVVASEALGARPARTIFRHVLPNALGPVLVAATFAVASGILTESALSFLGFGVQLPIPSWGSLLVESRNAEYWWIQVFPGLAVFLTVILYNMVGEGVRDALDPRLKEG